jgi:Carboxypeptidase regulatory-like domain
LVHWPQQTYMRLRDAISRLPILLALLLFPAISVSQNVDDSQTKNTVSGQVVNSVTGQPIAGALVQVGAEAAMMTDREGQFEFHDVNSFSGAEVTKPGYFFERRGSSDLTGRGQANQPITLKLVPEAIVFGKVLDQNGQPLQGLRVQLKTLQVHDGLRHWEQRDSTTTNVEGEFRFFELQAGKYSLSTAFQIDGSPDAQSAVAFAPVVYPPLSGSEESSLNLSPGDHVETNLNPPSQSLYPVTGHIEGPAAQGARFEAERSTGGTINPVVRFNRLTGDFRLMLPSGSYRLKLHAFVQREQFFATREISIGEAPLKNLLITLAPLATVPVEIEYQGSNTSSQEAQPPPPFFANVGLEELDPSGLGRTFNAQPPQPSGPVSDSLFIRDLEPGEYRLTSRPGPPWYLASAVCGNLDLKRDPMSVGGSAAGCSIHAVLRNDSATLHWSVNPTSQRKQVFVYAMPLDNFVQSISMISTQQLAAGDVEEGSLEGLAPGHYLVIALDHSEELPYREPDLIQRYLSEGKEVTLSANGKSEVQLDVVAGEP